MKRSGFTTGTADFFAIIGGSSLTAVQPEASFDESVWCKCDMCKQTPNSVSLVAGTTSEEDTKIMPVSGDLKQAFLFTKAEGGKWRDTWLEAWRFVRARTSKQQKDLLPS